MKSEGWEDLLLDFDVSGIVGSAIRESFGTSVDQDDKQVDLELVDLAVDGWDDFCASFSHSTDCRSSGKGSLLY